ncbi:MAG: hypothetical protein KC467_16155 [Marinomonas atlantica]|nr:hypothetical protein [Marinomonas atlantica]
MLSLSLSLSSAAAATNYKLSKSLYKRAVEIEKLMAGGNYDVAMEKIESSLTLDLKNDPQGAAWLYKTQSTIYLKRRHLHHAIAAADKSLELKPNAWLKKSRARWMNGLNSSQHERTDYDYYHNYRNRGISTTLDGKINVAYIYLDDGRWSQWTLKNRARNTTHMARVEGWLREQASGYGVNNIQLNVRYFMLKPKKTITPSGVRGRHYMSQNLERLSHQLGFPNGFAFIREIRGPDPDTKVAIVFHANAKARSFARICHSSTTKHNCIEEYVMLTADINHWKLEFTQAHEFLHLFGAADLYNIKKAKNYAVTDVMNYTSSDLKYANILPITAWAVGWGKLPKTPFKVEK